eukprot:m51a1_g5826 hypothetical protein (702) ;mRNA; f:243951-247769
METRRARVSRVFVEKLTELDTSIGRLRAATATIDDTTEAHTQARMLVLVCESLRGALNETRANVDRIGPDRLDLICGGVTRSRSAADHVKDLIDRENWHALARFVNTTFEVLAAAGTKFTTSGSKLLRDGQWVVLKGIGFTCTEYMMKPGMDDKEAYKGFWARNYCFGGPTSAGGPVELNAEVDNVLKYLKPDTKGGSFVTSPAVKKVDLGTAYNQAVEFAAPQYQPAVRVPMAGSSYLYDEDTTTGDASVYRAIVDKLVAAFTSQGIVVVLDLHWNCPDSTKLSGCAGAQAASMAAKQYGGKPGSVHLWDVISKAYAGNPYVFYELFNEPWIGTFEQWYAGDSAYAGMREMYDAVRANAPDGIVVIGGKDQYALDAQSGLAYYLRYKEERGKYPTGIMWNSHPYVGAAQGLEHSLPSVMRIALALKQVGPVVFTEFGQYCCSVGGTACKGGKCDKHEYGDFFVYNVANTAAQYDVSWLGWGWRGVNRDNSLAPCEDGMAECNQPDMRDVGGVLTDGSRMGANWAKVWADYVAAKTITVRDAAPKAFTTADYEPEGFLPRPCIHKGFNLGNICGWDLRTDVRTLKSSDFSSQTMWTGILPGLPPTGHCSSQGCPGFQCETYTGPCSGAAPASSGTQPASTPASSTPAHSSASASTPASRPAAASSARSDKADGGSIGSSAVAAVVQSAAVAAAFGCAVGPL